MYIHIYVCIYTYICRYVYVYIQVYSPKRMLLLEPEALAEAGLGNIASDPTC